MLWQDNSKNLMIIRPTLVLLLGVTMMAPLASSAQQTSVKRIPQLDEIFASNKFSGERFRHGRWADEGPIVTFVEHNEDVTDLVSYNLETDQQKVNVAGSDLVAPDVDRSIRIESYAFSGDKSRILIYTDSERVWRLNTKGYYYVYDVASKTLTPVSDRSKGFQMFCKFSPSADRVAFVRDRNLFVVDLADMTERQLTHDGSEGTIINGTSDWVYEEEFGLRDGWSWSPDGKYIAFFNLDESHTRDFAMTDLRGLYPEYERFRYPKAGERNSEIRIGIIDLSSGETRHFDTDTWFSGGDTHEYISQMGWTPRVNGVSHVWMFRLNRDQNDLDLLYGNPVTSGVSVVLEEQSKTWLGVETGFNDLDVGNLTYLRDDQHFLWISERNGYRHLYLYKNDGTFVGQLTKGEWDVTDFHGIDERKNVVYFTATRPSPMERQLFRVSAEAALTRGTDGRTPADPIRISSASGWHSFDWSRDFRYYIDSHSDAGKPTTTILRKADGKEVKVLEDNMELIAALAEYRLPKPEFMRVPGADGTMLNAWVIKPTKINPRRAYPLLMHVYGGPGSQTVRDSWGGSRYLWHAYLAEEMGVIVASVDNRGTGGRGNQFKSVTYRNLGLIEAMDQIAAAKHFGSLPYVDGDRIGIWGWSYGGFMTLMSMLTGEGPSTFRAGIAVAPVTDWRLYDTIYTERYMSTPQKNQEGYDKTAPTKYAANLTEGQRLLIVHGDFDDNVHYQNSVHMVDALQEANRQFQFMVYPGRNHGIFGGMTRLHLHTMMTEFIKNNL